MSLKTNPRTSLYQEYQTWKMTLVASLKQVTTPLYFAVVLMDPSLSITLAMVKWQWEELDELFNHKINDRVTQDSDKRDELTVLIITDSKQIMREADTFTSYAASADKILRILHLINKDWLLLINGSMIQLYYLKSLRMVDESSTIPTLFPLYINLNAGAVRQWASRTGTSLFVQALNAENQRC